MKRSIYDEYSCKIGFNTRFQLDNDVSKGSAIFFFLIFFFKCCVRGCGHYYAREQKDTC